jgi:futalosine hydrolase
MNPSDVLIAAPTSIEMESLQAGLDRFCITDTLVTGVGPGATAHWLTMRLAREPLPSLVILAGIGGAYEGSGVKVRDVCVACSETYGDLGRCADGKFEPIVLPGEEIVATYFNLLPVWKQVTPPEKLTDAGIRSVPMATVSCSSGHRARAVRLAQFTGAAIENMEGAAAAQSCISYGIPLLEIRAISNMAGEADRSKWDIKGALKRLGETVPRVLDIVQAE